MTNSINNKGNHIKITMCHHALKAESGMKSFVGRKDLVAAVYYTIRKCTRGGWPEKWIVKDFGFSFCKKNLFIISVCLTYLTLTSLAAAWIPIVHWAFPLLFVLLCMSFKSIKGDLSQFYFLKDYFIIKSWLVESRSCDINTVLLLVRSGHDLLLEN